MPAVVDAARELHRCSTSSPRGSAANRRRRPPVLDLTAAELDDDERRAGGRTPWRQRCRSAPPTGFGCSPRRTRVARLAVLGEAIDDAYVMRFRFRLDE